MANEQLPSSIIAGVNEVMEQPINFEALRRARTAIKGKITRLGNWIASVEQLEDVTVDDLEPRLSLLYKYYDEFENVQNQIERVSDEQQDSENQRSRLGNQFLAIVSQYKKFIRSISSPQAPPVITQPLSDDGMTSGRMFSSAERTMPTQTQDDFSSFSELFRAIIDDSPNLSNTARHYYLRSALKGEAANVLKSIPATGDHYQNAWNLLNERYMCKGSTVYNLHMELLNLSPMHGENTVTLRKLYDNILRILRSLKSHNTIHNDSSNSIYVSIILSKIDFESKKAFRMSLETVNYIPTLDDIQTFLSKRLQMLESLQGNKKEGRHVASLQTHIRPVQGSNNKPLNSQQLKDRQGNNMNTSSRNKQSDRLSHPQNKSFACLECNSHLHRIAQCPRYLNLSIPDRVKWIKSHLACFNCLSTNHLLATCTSRYFCAICSGRHHTTIHNHPSRDESREEASPSSSDQVAPTISLLNRQSNKGQVMLGTARILLMDYRGIPQPVRCLVDSGSEANLITYRLARCLKLHYVATELQISGIGQSAIKSTKRVFTQLRSTVTKYTHNTEFLTVPTITSFLPTAKIDTSGWYFPQGVQLADEYFDTPGPIEVLLGAEIFYDILESEKIQGTSQQPTLIKTKLGHIFGGRFSQPSSKTRTYVHLSLTEQVEKFWKLDESSPTSNLTPEEIECERHFLNTHARSSDGRYIVQLPKRKDPSTLGHSRSQARRRWLSVEARLAKNTALREGYHSFMQTYLDLGHMSLVGPENEVADQQGTYYLPHHPVIREQSTSTRIRVVFDGSMITSNGTSLNNILSVGPTVQSELFDILLRFRRHRFVLKGDIEKMFRQVLINKTDRKLQLVFWRASTKDPLCIYELNTVTYGTSPAPFLSTRSLKQLALDERSNYPKAAEIVLNDFYVDDLLSGHDNLNEALQLQDELIQLLSLGGFPLKKWASNAPEILENVPPENREKLFSLDIASADAVKTLGLNWIPDSDMFVYDASNITKTSAHTKRQILSQLASLYDPLGILAPIVCNAKIFMQELWKIKVDWDDTLPAALTEKWAAFNKSLEKLTEIKIPRFAASNYATNYELHGFADASEHGYGSALYLKTKDSEGKHSVRLLCAKSRVAPMKQITLPRLELAASLLLVRLMKTVYTALKIPELRTYCWSDSQIVLAWLRGAPHQWTNFVGNRVSEIQEFQTTWNYIPSASNPADLISRGCTVVQLKNSSLWWAGPTSLLNSKPNVISEIPHINPGEIPEKRKAKNIVIAVVKVENDIFSLYSSLHMLVSVTAWIRRFVFNCKNSLARLNGPLHITERDKALSCLIRIAQLETFTLEISSINRKGHVPKKSKLRQLSPFLDENNLLRVGGRLKHSPFARDKKHPLILAPNHPLTSLIIQQTHLKCLHGGAQLVLTTLRQKYWIINGKNIIRKIIHKCITCFKNKPKNEAPMMGQLPSIRTTPARPFYHTGVDFAGPFLLKPPTRSKIKLKYYVAVFVCLVTKSVHLELVGSLTSENFLATLKRFVSRRGLCRSISCDNAKNFVGTKNLLNEVYAFLRENNEAISNQLAHQEIEWKFIPPVSPHWGGIWEASVKSMKYHLKRVAGLACLNYEEFSTLLCSIEACLNSRPLTPLSTDPSDLEALTPGHFLIGAPLLSVPEINYKNEPISRLTRWYRIQHITQHFWKRWSSEYITTLTPLSKWKDDNTTLAVDILVLVKDDNLPPLHWKLGRITAVHPGKDNITRVATIKTSAGSITRNACKIFPLPDVE